MKQVALALALCACSRQDFLPPLGDSGTELLLVGEAGDTSWSDHRIVALTSTFAWSFEVDESTRFEGLVFDRTPAELGLEEGWTFRSAEGRPLRDDEYRISIAALNGGRVEWMDAVPTHWSRSVRMPEPCRQIFPGWERELPQDLGIRGLVARADGTAVLVMGALRGDTTFFEVGDDLQAISTSSATVNFAFAAPDGSMILAGRGRYSIGDPRSGFRTFAEDPAIADEMMWSSITERNVIFGLSSENRLHRVTSSTWDVLHQFDEVIDDSGSGSVAAISDARVFVISRGGDAIWLVDTDQQRLERENTAIDCLLADRFDRMESVQLVPGVGAFAGTRRGRVLQRRDDSEYWQVIRDSPPGYKSEVDVILPYGAGFLVSGDGAVDRFAREDGFCSERYQLGLLLADYGAVIRGGLALAGHRLDGRRYLNVVRLGF